MIHFPEVYFSNCMNKLAGISRFWGLDKKSGQGAAEGSEGRLIRSSGLVIDTRAECVVVGVNRFTVEEEKPIPILQMDESLERKQVDRLRALRARRDGARWSESLRKIEETARSGADLILHILNAVEACATIGEISNTM